MSAEDEEVKAEVEAAVDAEEVAVEEPESAVEEAKDAEIPTTDEKEQEAETGDAPPNAIRSDTSTKFAFSILSQLS